MNFLAIAELMGIVLLVLFILRALIGVRREYRVRERRLHMLCAADVSGAVEVVPDLLTRPIAIRATNRTGLFLRRIPEIRDELESRARSQTPNTSRADSGVATNRLHPSGPSDIAKLVVARSARSVQCRLALPRSQQCGFHLLRLPSAN